MIMIINDGSDADNDHNDDNNDALFAGWCDVQAGSKVLRRSNRLNFGRQIHFKKHLPSFDLMKIRGTNEKLAFPSRFAALEISWLLCLNQNRSLKNPSKFSARPTGDDIDDYDDIGEADKGTPP